MTADLSGFNNMLERKERAIFICFAPNEMFRPDLLGSGTTFSRLSCWIREGRMKHPGRGGYKCIFAWCRSPDLQGFIPSLQILQSPPVTSGWQHVGATNGRPPCGRAMPVPTENIPTIRERLPCRSSKPEW